MLRKRVGRGGVEVEVRRASSEKESEAKKEQKKKQGRDRKYISERKR
jgi:hypothetical protein